MKQVIVIGGGETFDTYEEYLDFLRYDAHVDITPRTGKGWKKNLQEALGSDYQVIIINMPNPLNARYKEWCITFTRMLDYIESDTIFVGHSLGGMFLFDYLDGHNLVPKATLFVGTPIPAVKGFGDFPVKTTVELVSNYGKVHIFHSKDDHVVSVREAFLYNSIFIDAQLHLFSNRGHFNDEQFPELVKVIKGLTKKQPKGKIKK